MTTQASLRFQCLFTLGIPLRGGISIIIVIVLRKRTMTQELALECLVCPCLAWCLATLGGLYLRRVGIIVVSVAIGEIEVVVVILGIIPARGAAVVLTLLFFLELPPNSGIFLLGV